MRILVTGGAGFIGSNLTDALLSAGHQVVVLDNFLTGRRENLLQCAGNENFRLIEGDIRDMGTCETAAAGCDCVFHQAALGSVPRSLADPRTSLEINVQGFVNVIEASRRSGVKRFIFASSSSVYGDDPSLPKRENGTGKALSPYALSKQMDEAVAENYGRSFGFRTVGLRYFNVFGRRQDPAGPYAAVIPKFAASLIRHESPVINGDGSYSRDFTYIDNVVQANLLAMKTENPEALDQVYNVACGVRTTLRELFTFLRESLSGFDPEIAKINPVYGPCRAGDIPHSLADTEKISRLLGYVPMYDVRTGLKLAAEWYRKSLGPSV